MNVRQGATEAWSTFGFVDNANRLGLGRAQLDYATDDFRDNAQLTLNQTWNSPPGTRLGSSLFLGREQIADASANRIGVAMNGGGDIRSNLAFDVDARWDTSDGQSSYDNVLASAALNWAFATGWTMGANYYLSRNSWRTPFEVTSPIPGLPSSIDQRSDDEGFFVSVRYQWQAGSRTAAARPAGRAVGSGRVGGVPVPGLRTTTVGMDAGEAGAPNVVVLLNGRFRGADQWRRAASSFRRWPQGAHVLTVVQGQSAPAVDRCRTEGRASISVECPRPDVRDPGRTPFALTTLLPP